MTGFIRLAPDRDDPTLGLSRDEAKSEANAAFRRAKKAQARLVSDLGLTAWLTEPGLVNRGKLRGMIRRAEEQVTHAQEVVVALIESMEALERYTDPKPDGGNR